jgi:hypothetical protein
MFELTEEEHEVLGCQFGTLKRGKHSKYPRMDGHQLLEYNLMPDSKIVNFDTSRDSLKTGERETPVYVLSGILGKAFA